MKTSTTNIRAALRSLRRLPGFALVLAAFALLAQPTAKAANGPPLYLDVNDTTPGFGSPSGGYNLWGDAPGAFWTTDSTGSSATTYYNPYGANAGDGLVQHFTESQWTFGAAGSDFAASTFTIHAWYMARPICGLAINSTSANVTLDGYNYNFLVGAQTWTVAEGSTLTEATGAPDRGLNCDNNPLTLTGGGTINFNSHIGFNSWSGGNGKITEDGVGLVVNLNVNQAASASPFGAGFTLANGTLNFANATSYDAFSGFTSSAKPFAINGGTLDNTSGSAMTLSVGTGGYSLGGNVTFTGTNSLSFGTAPVALTATPQITVGANTLTIGGPISGSGFGLTKAGNGTLILNGESTYDGPTTVTAGTFGGTGTLTGAAIFDAGSKAVFTVTPGGAIGNNSTLMTIAGMMTFNANEVHLKLPVNLPGGTYVLAISSATPVANGAFTLVVDSGSFASSVTSTAITLDTVNKQLVLTAASSFTGPVTLAIPQVNGGANPTAGSPFAVVVESRNGNSVATPVSANTAVTLSVKSGAGTLGGTLSGTIPAGQSQVTIIGVTYGTAQSGVVLKANRTSGDNLNSGDSAAFTVNPVPTLVIGAEQFNNGVSAPSPIAVVSDDLLELSGVVATGGGWSQPEPWMRNGLFTDENMLYQQSEPLVMTYALDLGSYPLGYDIDEIRMFSEASQYRSGQSYDILYSLVGAPDTFIPLGTVLTPTGEYGALMTRTFDSRATTTDGGPALLTGVAKIRFNFRKLQDGIIWREFDVTGTPTGTSRISGSVTLDGSGLSGVSVTDGTRTVTTAADGTYTITAVPAGTYTVSAAKNGYVFTPASLSVTMSGVPVTGKDFAAAVTYMVVGEKQVSADTPSPIGVVAGDLLEMGGVVCTSDYSKPWDLPALVNGSWLGGGDPYSNVPFVTTYALDLATNPLGYNIKEIRMFTDQGGDRAGQSYDIYYSLINAPDAFVLLGSVSTPHTDSGAVMTRTYDSRTGATPDAGPAILSGVAKIQFHVRPVGDYGVVWREFDVTGAPTGGGGTTYADWAAANGVVGTPNEDSNHDGVQNGIAYFMGATGLATNPVPDASNTVTWPMSAAFSGTYQIETSPDLGTWTPVTPRPTPVGGYLTYTLPSGASKLFVRLVATPN